MIQGLIERLNNYCAENNVACMDDLSLELLSELGQYKLDYVTTVDVEENRWYALAEKVYRVCIDGKTYYLGVWEVAMLKSEAIMVSDCGHVMKFYEMEEYTTVSYRRKNVARRSD